MDTNNKYSEQVSLVLCPDGSIAKCQDGAVIIQYTDTLRCSVIDPVQYRDYLLEMFGPEVVNICIGKNDGSSGSGPPPIPENALWNDFTIRILIQSLKLTKPEFIANPHNEAIYMEIANLMNVHELFLFYTPGACRDKIIELTKDYSYQLFKTYVFDAADCGKKFEYFDLMHDIFGNDFPGSKFFAGGICQETDQRLKALGRVLKKQNKAVLKNQKLFLHSQRRVMKAFLQFENIIEYMQKIQPAIDTNTQNSA